MRNELDRVDAEGIDAHFLDPVAVRIAQRLAHHRVVGVQVVEIRDLVVQLLIRIVVVGDRRRPVVDRRGALRGIGGVVLIERRLLRLAPRHRLRVLDEPLGDVVRVVARVREEVPHVVGDYVLDQVHAALVQLRAELLVRLERPEVLVDRL